MVLAEVPYVRRRRYVRLELTRSYSVYMVRFNVSELTASLPMALYVLACKPILTFSGSGFATLTLDSRWTWCNGFFPYI